MEGSVVGNKTSINKTKRNVMLQLIQNEMWISCMCLVKCNQNWCSLVESVNYLWLWWLKCLKLTSWVITTYLNFSFEHFSGFIIVVLTHPYMHVLWSKTKAIFLVPFFYLVVSVKANNSGGAFAMTPLYIETYPSISFF